MTTAYPFSARSQPQPTDALPPGAVLRSRFVVIRQITTTALSHVYLGHDQLTGRAVAIKQPRTPNAHSGVKPATVLHLFQREAHILRRLQHPQIPGLLAAFRDHSSVFLVIEYIAGITLEQRLSREAVPLDEALAIANKLCRVIDYLHLQTPPIIHADIKPGNIMLSEDERVVLLDYGLARPRDAQKRTNPAVGTPGYAPPEQWRGEPLDERGDVYALGMVLREMFGVSPTPAIQQALARATAPEASDRFATVAQLYRALNRSNEQTKMKIGGHGRAALQTRSYFHARWCAGWHMPAPLNMFVALILVGIVFMRIAYETTSAPTIATQKPAMQVILLSSISLPTPGTPIDRPAIAMARIALDQYQQYRIDAIARQNAGIIALVADDQALENIRTAIDRQRDLGAHMQITPITLHIVDTKQIGDDRIEVVVDKTEDRLLYPAGCTMPDDQPPCWAAEPVTVRSEHYQVRYIITRKGERWKVTSWTVISQLP